MLTLLLLTLAPAWAQCPGDGTIRDLSRALAGAEYAAVQRDSVSFGDRWGQALDRLPCVDEPLTPDVAWTLYALDGLDVALKGDVEAATASFASARGLFPHDPPPEWLGKPGTKLEQRWQAASGLETTWQEVALDHGLELTVDGLSGGRLPANRPALVQLLVVDDVADTALVRPGGPLPEGVARVLPPPPPEPPPVAVAGCDLTVATEQLKAGHYEDALDTSLLSIPTCPEQAATYQVVAAIATERLEARRATAAPSPPPAPPRPPQPEPPPPEPEPEPEAPAALDSWVVDDAPPPGEWEVPGDEDDPLAIPMVDYDGEEVGDEPEPTSTRVEGDTAEIPRESGRTLRIGGEAGSLIGGRIEQQRPGKRITAFGGRAGGLLHSTPDTPLAMAALAAGFADVRLGHKWELEGSAGFLVHSEGPGAVAGLALQYEPTGPFFINIGGWLPTSTSPAWDLTLGMVF